jgi:hypothetical protein
VNECIAALFHRLLRSRRSGHAAAPPARPINCHRLMPPPWLERGSVALYTRRCKRGLTMCAAIVCRYGLAKGSQVQVLGRVLVGLFTPDLNQFSLASFFHFQFQTEPAHSRFAGPSSRIRDRPNSASQSGSHNREHDTIKAQWRSANGYLS